MTRSDCLRLSVASLFMLSTSTAIATAAGQSQLSAAASQASGAAADAAKASPDLVNDLSKELNVTPAQAAGAAGALFGVAKTRMTPTEFSQVADAVPGMDMLLKAAPQVTAVGTSGAVSPSAGMSNGLAQTATAFTKLGLSPDLVGKAVPVLTSFVSKGAGADIGNLLGGVLK